MLPVYGQMNSYPHQSNQVPFVQYLAPAPPSETVPPQMGLNTVPPQMGLNPAMCTPWPHGSNYGYPIPCHACCSHNSFPGGYYTPTPPCPHIVPAQPYHYNHSTFPQFYPVQYIPPPHYSVEMPRYEYDKNVLRNNHCCGCPNHACNQKEDKSVKVEEMEPDVGKMGNNSLIPVQLGKHPYPVVWIPPELMKKKELSGQEKVASQLKSPEISEFLQQGPNGWFPLDMKDLGFLKKGEDKGTPQNEQDEDTKRNFPFPIIWMPYDGKKEIKNDHKTEEDSREISEIPNSEPAVKPSQIFKVLPMKHTDGFEGRDEPKATQDDTGGKMVEKRTSLKSIPVMQIGHHEGRNSEDAKKEGVGVSVKQTENGASKASESNGKKQPSSPSKTTKLPPVCLRVDPLPKKKNGKGSSRSPSPPGQKRRAEAAMDSENLVKDPQVCESIQNKEMDPNREVGRTIQVMERQPVENKDIQVMEKQPVENKDGDLKADVCSEHPVNLHDESNKEMSQSTTSEKAVEGGNESVGNDERSANGMNISAQEAIQGEIQMDSSKSAEGEYQGYKRSLTDVEAAVLIQSVYRGFEVRRWDPLKKLKQIAEVRGQLVDVRNRIEALESSEDLLKDNKQKACVGEMIMRLLLKLDSIQGLHPSLREIRKSLARELVTLQEKLDSLMAKKSKERTEEVSSHSPVRHVDAVTDVGNKEVQTKEEEQGLQKSSCHSSQLDESSCNNSVAVMDLPDSQSTVEPEGEAGKEDLSATSVTQTEKGNCARIDQEQTVQLPSIAEKRTNSEEEIMESVTENLSCDDTTGVGVKELKESLQEVSGKETFGSEMGELTEEGEFLHVGVDSISPAEPVLPEKDDKPAVSDCNKDGSLLAELPIDAAEVDPEVPELEPAVSDCNNDASLIAELPVEAAEVDPEVPELDSCQQVLLGAVDAGVPEFESHEQIDEGKNEILSGEKSQYDVSIDASQPKDEAPRNPKEQQALEIVDVTQPREGLKVGTYEDNEVVGDTADQIEDPQVEVVDMVQQQEIESPSEGSTASVLPQLEKEGEADEEEEEKQEMEAGEMGGPVTDTKYDMNQAAAAASCKKEEEGQMRRDEIQEPGNNTESDKQANESEDLEQEAPVEQDEIQEPRNNTETDKQANESEDVEQEALVEQVETECEEDQLHRSDNTLFMEAKSTEQQKEKGEAEQVSMDVDRRLIEENEKMREVMAKLMETGKEQLTVISNLTGRVKELEKKLSKRKKKLKTLPRHRRLPSGSSRFSQSMN